MHGQYTSNAHAILDYLISQAVLSGKTGETKLSIPMTDFMSEHEGVKFTDDASDVVLTVTITTNWDANDDVEELITNMVEEDEDDFGNN